MNIKIKKEYIMYIIIFCCVFLINNTHANEVSNWLKINSGKTIADWFNMDLNRWYKKNPKGTKSDYKRFSAERIKWIKNNPNQITESFFSTQKYKTMVNNMRVIQVGPKIKGLYLGMRVEAICDLINTKFTDYKCFLFTRDKAYVENNKIYGLQVAHGLGLNTPILFSLDNKNKVNSILLLSSFTNEAFNSWQLQGKEFAQQILNNYKEIGKAKYEFEYFADSDVDWSNNHVFGNSNKIVDDSTYVFYLKNMEIKGNGWNYRNITDGWAIFITADKNIILKKLTKKSNLSFD